MKIGILVIGFIISVLGIFVQALELFLSNEIIMAFILFFSLIWLSLLFTMILDHDAQINDLYRKFYRLEKSVDKVNNDKYNKTA